LCAAGFRASKGADQGGDAVDGTTMSFVVDVIPEFIRTGMENMRSINTFMACRCCLPTFEIVTGISVTQFYDVAIMPRTAHFWRAD
jgi:hypothetical protein